MATQPNTQFSDMENKQAESLSEPSLGDLASLDGLGEADNHSTPSLGDQLGISDSEEHSELLGDISLLEEAIAELETDVDETADSTPEKSASAEDMDVSTEFDEGLAGLVSEDDLASEVLASQPISESIASAPVSEPVLASEPVIASEPSIASEPAVASEPVMPNSSAADDQTSSVPVLDEEVELSNTVMQFNAEQEAELTDQSIPTLDQLATDFSQPESIPVVDQVSQATGDFSMGVESHTSIPLEKPLSDIDSDAAIPDISLGGQFSEALGSGFSEASGGYSEPASALTKAVEHKVSMGAKSELNLSIPYELHAQLSKKIDGLVIEAATSITNELHHQLTLRMETLLTQAVESVLPNLMDQMANGLRTEVKEKVRSQLPNIVNDVLSTTRLSDK